MSSDDSTGQQDNTRDIFVAALMRLGVSPETITDEWIADPTTLVTQGTLSSRTTPRPEPNEAVNPSLVAAVTDPSPNSPKKVGDSSKDSSMGMGDSSMGIEAVEGDSSMGIDETRERLRALGICVDAFDDAFDCPLPGHDHEATLVWSRRKHWDVRCGETRAFYGFADVRAAVAYGRTRRLSGPEANRWRDRLDHEAGILTPVPVGGEVPDDLSEAARRLLRGLRLYLGLRAARRGGFPASKGYTFAREFAMAWCGLTDDQVKHGMRELRDRHLFGWTGEKVGRAKVWRLATASEYELREAA